MQFNRFVEKAQIELNYYLSKNKIEINWYVEKNQIDGLQSGRCMIISLLHRRQTVNLQERRVIYGFNYYIEKNHKKGFHSGL